MYHSKNLEIHVADHCNLDCIGCSHESPLMPRWFEDPDRIERALSLLWKCYRAPLVKLLGGEPLLHPRIADIISICKTTTRSRIRIVTNGTLLQQRYNRLQGVDEIHISVYPNVVIPSMENIRSIAEQIGAFITIQKFDHFRWYRSPASNKPNVAQRIFATCQPYNSWQCHTLRDGWLHPCPPAATWADSAKEGVNLLTDISDIESKICRLLTRMTPFGICSWCFGSVGQRFKHHFGWRNLCSDTSAFWTIDTKFLRFLESNRDAHNGCYEYQLSIDPSGQIRAYEEHR